MKAKKLDIRKLWTVLKHQLLINWILSFMIPLMLVFNLILAVATPDTAPSGAIDVTAIFFIATIGFIVQGALFRYCQYNGTSRRTYFLASVVFIVIVAIFATLISTILSHIIYATGNTSFDLFSLGFPHQVHEYYNGVYMPTGEWVIQSFLYGEIAGNFIMRLFWTLSMSLGLAFFAWFIKVVFDTLSRKGRFIALGLLVALVIIIILLSVFVLDNLLGTVFGFFMGLTHFGHGAVAAAFSSMWGLLFAAGFGLGVWLILKKLPVG